MSRADLVLRRRAIYTGLKPFLDEPDLLTALRYWEAHFANSPRFTLQRFVATLCQDNALRARRGDILLSLVEAVGLPEPSLLADPFEQRTDAITTLMPECLAFNMLMTQLLECTPKDLGYSLRLDLISSLDSRTLPTDVFGALHNWLNDRAELRLQQAEPAVLRALVSRTYVLLCERLGPVHADKVLATAMQTSARLDSALTPHLNRLL